jgi:hypothetical protein
MAERTGIFVFTSAQTTNNALNREYKDLFLQREAIQARMRVIEEELGKEEYGKLVAEIEAIPCVTGQCTRRVNARSPTSKQ